MHNICYITIILPKIYIAGNQCVMDVLSTIIWTIHCMLREREKIPHKISSQEKTPQKSPVEKIPHPILGLVEKTPHPIFRLVEKTPQLYYLKTLILEF